MAVSVGWVAAVNEFHLEGGAGGVGAYSRKHNLHCKLKRFSGGSALSLFPHLPHSSLGSVHQFPICCESSGKGVRSCTAQPKHGSLLG